jgi:hypothetical protein
MGRGKFKYRIGKVDPRALRSLLSRKGGPTIRGRGMGAGAELLQYGVQKLGQLALYSRVKRELFKLESAVDKVMPSSGGVLVRVTIKRWKHPDPTGVVNRAFHDIGIAGVGANPQEALRKWYSRDRLLQGAPGSFSTLKSGFRRPILPGSPGRLVRSGQRVGFDSNGDGIADTHPPFVRKGSTMGYDLNGDGTPDVMPPFVKKGMSHGFDFDGDGSPDFCPPVVRKSGVCGLDMDGDGTPDIVPAFVPKITGLGVDLDGNGKPDYVAPVRNRGGRAGYDLNGDGFPDLFPAAGKAGLGPSSFLRELGKGLLPGLRSGPVGFDIDGDGRPDYFPGSTTPTKSQTKPPPGYGGVDGDPKTPW